MIKWLRVALDLIINIEDFFQEKKFLKSQWREQAASQKLAYLNEQIAYAQNNYKSYRQKLVDSCVTVPLSSLSQIELLPVMEKKDVQKMVAEYKDKDISDNRVVWHTTTGSTGTPLTFPCDYKSERIKNGARRRLYRWYGLSTGDTWVKLWRGDLNPSLKDRIRSFLTGRYTISIYDPKDPLNSALDDSRIREIIERLESIQPKVIDGFVSALVEISKYLLRTETRLKIDLSSVVTGAERLSDSDRMLIRKAFDAPVYERYGGTEISIIGHECEYQAGNGHLLHLQEDRILVNYVSNNQEGVSEILVTDLFSRPIPFIKYRIGDVVKGDIVDEKCPCGRSGLQLMGRVDGRKNEFLFDKNRKKVSSHIIQNYIKKHAWIESYQVVQSSDYSVEVLIVKNDRVEKNEELLKFELGKIFCAETLSVSFVGYIPKGTGGKFNQHICKVI